MLDPALKTRLSRPVDSVYGSWERLPNRSSAALPYLRTIAKQLTKKLLLRDFIEYSLKEHKHGFRPAHSTTTGFNIITNNVQKGLNQKKPCNRTLLVALDLTAAYNTVDHNLLLRDILEAPLPNNTERGVASYLQGRFSYVEYRLINQGGEM